MKKLITKIIKDNFINIFYISLYYAKLILSIFETTIVGISFPAN